MASPPSSAADGRALVAPKPAPALHEARPGRARMFLDLGWLAGTLFRAAPLPSSLWTAIALLQGLLVPAQLWLTKSLVDALATQLRGGEAAHTFLWLGLLVASLIAERGLGGVQPWLQAWMRERSISSVQQRVMMRKSSTLDLASFEHQGYYDDLNRVTNDVETRLPNFLSQSLLGLQSLPQFLGYAGALFVLSSVLPLVVLVAVILTFLVFALSGQTNWALLSAQTREQRLSEYYARVLTDRRFAKEVRLYGLAGYLRGRWAELFWSMRNEQRRPSLSASLRQRGAVLLMVAVTMLGLWWVVSARMLHASPGGYALLFQSLQGMIGASFTLASTLQLLGESSGYASDLRAFLGQPEEPAARSPLPGEPAKLPAPVVNLRPFPRPLVEGISFEGVWYTYPGSEVPALRDVSLQIRAGKRVALARAFFRQGDLLVLDEPTAALDPMAELRLFERFSELARGRTALLISHRLGMARLADRVVMLDGGRVVEEGTHEELMERGGLYRRMFEAQAQWYR